MWRIPEPDIKLFGRIPWRLILELVLLVILAIALLSAWRGCHRPQAVVTNTQYQYVPVEKTVERIRTVTVPGPREIVTIEKPVIVEKLRLPEAIAKDPAKQVTANAEIPPPAHPGASTSVVSVLDTETGKTEIIAKEKPAPLFALLSDGELGLRYGVRSAGLQGGNVYGRWTFLRVGSLYLGTYGEIDTRPEAKAMLDLSWRF